MNLILSPPTPHYFKITSNNVWRRWGVAESRGVDGIVKKPNIEVKQKIFRKVSKMYPSFFLLNTSLSLLTINYFMKCKKSCSIIQAAF